MARKPKPVWLVVWLWIGRKVLAFWLWNRRRKTKRADQKHYDYEAKA